MLVNATAMLQAAAKGHYAVGAFNTNNLEWASSILDAAEELQSPVIIQCTSGAAKWQISYKASRPASPPSCTTAPTRRPSTSTSSAPPRSSRPPTPRASPSRPRSAASVASRTASPAWARLPTPISARPSPTWALTSSPAASATSTASTPTTGRASPSKEKVGDLPLVLHGGTGIPVDQIKKAISLGVSKINVNTDLQVVFAEATRKYIEAGKDQQGKGYDPRKLLKPGRDAIVDRTKELIVEFGSEGKGWA